MAIDIKNTSVGCVPLSPSINVTLSGTFPNYGAATTVACYWHTYIDTLDSSATCGWPGCKVAGAVVSAGSQIACPAPDFALALGPGLEQIARQNVFIVVQITQGSQLLTSSTLSTQLLPFAQWTPGMYASVVLAGPEGCMHPINCTDPSCPSNISKAWAVTGAVAGSHHAYTLIARAGLYSNCSGLDFIGELPSLQQCLGDHTSSNLRNVSCASVACTNATSCSWNDTILTNDEIAVSYSYDLHTCNYICYSLHCVALHSTLGDPSTLLHYKCGDGVVFEGAEECDDGNTVSDDGCSQFCIIESCKWANDEQ